MMMREMYFAHGFWLLAWIALLLPPFWKIFAKAGFSPWLSLLVLIRLANLAVLYVVARSRWPALRDQAER